MNMYMLTAYIIHGPFGDTMLSYDLQLNVGYNFTYVIKTILVVNVGCNYCIVTNWSHKLAYFFLVQWSTFGIHCNLCDNKIPSYLIWK
jgi:hypothetical protein